MFKQRLRKRGYPAIFIDRAFQTTDRNTYITAKSINPSVCHHFSNACHHHVTKLPTTNHLLQPVNTHIA